MAKNCIVCGDELGGRQIKFCSEFCAARAWHRNGVSRTAPALHKPGCGSRVERLSDVPDWVRMAAFESLVEAGELSDEELPLAFAAALEPGELSTRVA